MNYMTLRRFSNFLNRFNHFQFFLWIVLPAFGMIYPLCTIKADEQHVLYDAHGKRDPFVPLVTLSTKVSSGLLGVESIDEIMVEGVVYDPKNTKWNDVGNVSIPGAQCGIPRKPAQEKLLHGIRDILGTCVQRENESNFNCETDGDDKQQGQEPEDRVGGGLRRLKQDDAGEDH